MSEYEALIARLASADATITTLDAENADLHGEVRTLREQIEAQGETLARTLAHAHLDGTWPMELVDPEGRLFK